MAHDFSDSGYDSERVANARSTLPQPASVTVRSPHNPADMNFESDFR
jgi:hypothetical protein